MFVELKNQLKWNQVNCASGHLEAWYLKIAEGNKRNAIQIYTYSQQAIVRIKPAVHFFENLFILRVSLPNRLKAASYTQ